MTCAGAPRHLSGKAFELLEVLIANAPRALTKEELYQHIWGNRIVDEVNLPNLMSEVRTALGDRRKDPRFIKTIEVVHSTPSGGREWSWGLKRSWLRPEGRAVCAGIRLPFGRSIVTLCRAR